MQKILQRRFASMQYSHSVYSNTDIQHNLISGVLEQVNQIKNHKISITTTLLTFPFSSYIFPKIQELQSQKLQFLSLNHYAFFNQLNIARKSLPTSSILCSASLRRKAVNPGLPDWFSRTNSRANCPD